jgi:hypothetical protein
MEFPLSFLNRFAYVMHHFHEFIEPLCTATVSVDFPERPCSGAKMLIIFGLYAVVMGGVTLVWGPAKRVPKAEDQVLRYAADEPLPSASPAQGKASGVKAADQSGLRQRL